MKNWNDITLKQFNEIQNLLSQPDEYLTCNLLDVIYGTDSANMTIAELAPYKNALQFLTEPIPHCKLKQKYEINGTVYDSNLDLTVLTVAQFVDYQTYIKEEHIELNKVLSVFFTPEGHSYNDGYDMKKVQNDLLNLDIVTITTASFFFEIQFAMFVDLFQRSLKQTVKKTVKDKMKRKEMLKQLESDNLVSFLCLLPSATKQTHL